MYSSQGRPIGDEAIFEVIPALADKLWQEALAAGHDVPSWVDHEDEAEVRIGKLLLAADNLRGMLPSEIIEAGRHFREKGNDYGAWLVKGLEPPEVVTQITLDSCSFPAHLSVARAAGIMATALAMTAGPPITFTTRPAPGSGAGGPASMFLTSVGPVEGLENEPLSSGQAIGWHCEVGACDWRPLSLALFCIKGQPKAQTGVLPPHKISIDLTKKQEENWRETLFRYLMVWYLASKTGRDL